MDERRLMSKKALPLHRVFHGIRFKVNKGWSTAVLLFLCPYVSCGAFMKFTNLDFLHVDWCVLDYFFFSYNNIIK